MITSGEHLEHALDECLRRSFRRGQRPDVASVLARITTLAVEHLPGVDHAGITVVEEGDVIRCLAATDGHPLVLDNIQRSCLQGPCFDSASDHRICRAPDLTTEHRWPDFCAKAVVSTPVRAVLALPVFRDHRVHGHAALNLYADQPGTLDARVEASGTVIASYVAAAMTAGQRHRTSERSARTDVITQAKSLIMQRYNVDVAQAFALLVKMAKQQNESIEAVARQVVAPDGPSGRN